MKKKKILISLSDEELEIIRKARTAHATKGDFLSKSEIISEALQHLKDKAGIKDEEEKAG